MKKIALILGMTLLFQTTAFAIGTPTLETGVLDHTFSEGRTFYNVYLPDGTTQVPEITASGATLVTTAEGVTEDFGNKRITVLKDDATGKLYRFKFLVNSKVPSVTNFEIISDGLIKIEGITGGEDTKVVVYAPTSELSETSYSPETVTPANSKNAIVYFKQGTTVGNITHQLPADALSGNYRVVVGGNGVDKTKAVQKEYYYLSLASKQALLTTLSQITAIDGVGGLTEFLQTNGTKINIDFNEYNSFSDKSVFLSMLCGESFVQNPDNLTTAYQKAKLITTINLSSGSDLISLIEANDEVIGLDRTFYDKISDKTAFTSLWENSGADSYSNLNAYFKKVSAAAYVDEAEPEKLPERLGETYQTLGISETDYQTMLGLQKYDDFIIELSRLTFENESELVSWITTTTATYKSNETPGSSPTITPTPSTPSQNGGGGGGNHGFKTDFIPEVTYEPETEKPSDVVNENVFSDIESVPWAKEAILLLESWDIINGVGEGKFDPLSNVTREQFVHMIVTAFSISGDVEEVKFTDVNENDWYYESLKAALSKKIITGITAKEFGTGQLISRQDMAVIIERVAATVNIPLSVNMYPEKLNDLDTCGEYAKASVENISKAGIMTGTGDGKFSPNAPATRAMSAVVIYRLLKLN